MTGNITRRGQHSWRLKYEAEPDQATGARRSRFVTMRGTKTEAKHELIRLLAQQQNGTVATFDQARADFEAAWRVLLAKRTEADFQVWRDERDWTAEKYRRFDQGERMPPDWKPPHWPARV